MSYTIRIISREYRQMTFSARAGTEFLGPGRGHHLHPQNAAKRHGTEQASTRRAAAAAGISTCRSLPRGLGRASRAGASARPCGHGVWVRDHGVWVRDPVRSRRLGRAARGGVHAHTRRRPCRPGRRRATWAAPRRPYCLVIYSELRVIYSAIYSGLSTELRVAAGT